MQLSGEKTPVFRNAGVHDASGTGSDDSAVFMVSEAGLGRNVSSAYRAYCFAVQGFFVYLIMNFINGIPTELDEAAKIDGCSYYSIFFRIILPLVVPALITAGIFSFIWRWEDFLSPLLYVNKSELYPISLALKLFCDPASTSDYGAMFSMSVLSILPLMLIFILLQRYLVEGIASSGIKG